MTTSVGVDPLSDPASLRRLADELETLTDNALVGRGTADVQVALREAAAVLETQTKALAECYRLSGADPDGNEDWRLASNAVEEVRRLRTESDAQIEAAEAERDVARARCADLEDRHNQIDG